MNGTARCAKIGYGSETLAAKAAQAFNDDNVHRPYQCPICFRWHLTSHGHADGPLVEEVLLKLPGTGWLAPVEVVVRRLSNGRAVGMTLRPDGRTSFVAVSRRHLPALKAAIEEILHEL